MEWHLLNTGDMFIRTFFPARSLIVAIAVGATLLVGILYIPSLLRPGIPVGQFRELPDAVASDLKQRGCIIAGRKSVISEDFAGRGQRDWAVLCQRGNQASVLIYNAGSGTPAVLGTHGAGLVDNPEGARGLRLVRWDYVVRHNPGIRSVDVPSVCIEDGVGMGSSIYCYLNGAWVVLAGAD
jgi:hypothetical protein